ncbi:amino acid adenylation domain-containing protein [Flavobacterium sp. H122]|uniref:non-ribosomal peptide synthetase n=1 Tax=Flavobacterium sp. H122 TaxID=2529860 RepID=UPI0010AA6ED4|nr:non-ribosomal peptide synthetase [Flavobacterium sp. H122]
MVISTKEFALSKEQEGLWFIQQLSPENTAYNVVFGAKITGTLDRELLKKSFQYLIQRHSGLSTKFKLINGKPVQYKDSETETKLYFEEKKAVDFTNSLEQEIDKDTKIPFNLEQDSLIRFHLYEVTENEFVIVVTAHHIAMDLWSLSILVQELQPTYLALKNNEKPVLEPFTTSLYEHVTNQEKLLSSEQGEQLKNYWKEKIGNEFPILELPVDKSRPKNVTYNGAIERFVIDKDLTEKLNNTAKNEGVTLFMLMISAYKTLLHRYTNQDELLIGSPVALRNQKSYRNLIGNFVNTIVLKSSFNKNEAFNDFLKTVKNNVIEGMKHQDYPFSSLVKELKPARDTSRSPIVQTIFSWQKLPQLKNIEAALNGNESESLFRLESLDIPQQEGQFELIFEMGNEIDGTLPGIIKYNTDLFNIETIAQIKKSFLVLLESIVKNPSEKLGKLAIVSEELRNEMLTMWNDAPQEFPKHKTLHEAFEASVTAYPNNIALTFGPTVLTYTELNEKANQLAHHLVALGTVKGSPVGVCMERSAEVIIGILAILKSGGTYVPLDPKNPSERLNLIIEDSKMNILLTESGLTIDIAPENILQKINLDSDWDTAIASYPKDNLVHNSQDEEYSYILYTSGSTGRPKGVLNTHANVLRMFTATNHWYDIKSDDVFCLFHTYSFDISVWEIFGSLLYGAKLIVLSHDVSRNPDQLHKLIVDEKVTMLAQTPSAFKQLMNYDMSLETPSDFSLRFINFCGEALEIKSLRPWIDRYGDQSPKLINLYGITETTVYSTYREIVAKDLESHKSMIGRPFLDVEMFVLNEDLEPVPYGVTGEIYLGGEGIAKHYLNLPELTAERFLSNPFPQTTGDRIYKTGDLGKLYSNGDVEFIGRIDTQVKIRGFRVELGEIQSILATFPGIEDCVVTIKTSAKGEQRLVAYYIAKEANSLTDAALRNFCSERLPDYMVPAIFMEMEEFPLNNNRKTDIKKLPEPVIKNENSVCVPARDVTELELLKIWEDVLEVSPIGVTDDYFQLGGHSMLAVTMMSKIKDVFDKNYAISVLFEHPTIEKLAKIIRQEEQDTEVSPLVTFRKKETNTTNVFCVHPIGGNVFCYSQMVESFEENHNIYALQSPFLYQDGVPHVTVEDLAADYLQNIKKIQPEGPYNLVGYCFGGLISLEIAQQMTETGEEINSLTLLDTRSPLYEGETEFDDAILLSWFARDLAIPYGKTLTIDPAELRTLGDTDTMFDLVLARAKEKQIISDDIDYSQIHRYLQVYIANGAALATYESKPYAGKLNLLRAVDEPLIEHIGINLGWDRCNIGELNVIDVPGDHNTMLYNPNAKVVANSITAILKETEQNVILS